MYFRRTGTDVYCTYRFELRSISISDNPESDIRLVLGGIDCKVRTAVLKGTLGDYVVSSVTRKPRVLGLHMASASMTMPWSRYPKIAESSASFTDRTGGQWVCTEKVHGANFSVMATADAS